MFSPTIVQHDAFLDMPLSSQALYMHLCIEADDDGFVSPKRVMRMIGANDDDLRILLAKRYILGFDSGVVVIKHWHVNNFIRHDRYKATTYSEELAKLSENNFGAYTENDGKHKITEMVNRRSTVGQPDDIPLVDPGKVRLGKVSKETLRSYPANTSQDVSEIFDYYVEAFESSRSHIKLSDARKAKIKSRLKDAGKDMLKLAIKNTSESSWHRGDNDSGWKANLDYIIRSYEQVEKLSALEMRQKGAIKI